MSGNARCLIDLAMPVVVWRLRIKLLPRFFSCSPMVALRNLDQNIYDRSGISWCPLLVFSPIWVWRSPRTLIRATVRNVADRLIPGHDRNSGAREAL